MDPNPQAPENGPQTSVPPYNNSAEQPEEEQENGVNSEIADEASL